MIDVVLAILVAGSPSPSPPPSAAPVPLKTIVTLKTSPLCTAFARHVNAAIGSAVRNDATLSALIGSLHSDALDRNIIQRVDEENRLNELATSIYREYKSGMHEVQELRALAKTATNPQEQQAVKGSADALGGALHRQHLIQRDLDGFVAFLNTADMRTVDPDEAHDERVLGPEVTGFQPEQRGPITVWVPNGFDYQFQGRVTMPGDESHAQDVRYSLLASRDFQHRIPGIIRDELTAATRIDVAGSGC